MAAWILGLETSGRGGSVAIFDGMQQHMIDLAEWEPSKGEVKVEEAGSARYLAPCIEALLRKHDCRMSDLQAVAVTVGPGSFTGIRVGVATAKAMCFALKIPAIAVDSLECIAERFLAEGTSLPENGSSVRYWTLMDAYRGEFFLRQWSLQSGRMLSQSPSSIMERAAWVDSLAEKSENGTTHILLGPGAGRLLENDREGHDPPVRWKIFADIIPRASEVVRIGWRMLNEGKTVDPFRLDPVYLRRSAAEEKRDRP